MLKYKGRRILLRPLSFQSNHCPKPVSNTLKEEVRTRTALFPR